MKVEITLTKHVVARLDKNARRNRHSLACEIARRIGSTFGEGADARAAVGDLAIVRLAQAQLGPEWRPR